MDIEILKEKLKNRRGASIVIALLFFLMCTILGGIILTSAHTAAGRIDSMREEEQAYLTVASAAEVLAEEMDESVQVTYIKKWNRQHSILTCPGRESVPYWGDPEGFSCAGAGNLRTIMEKFYLHGNSEVEFTVSADSHSDVNVTATKAADDSIVFNLTEAGDLNYSLSFKMIATHTQGTAGTTFLFDPCPNGTPACYVRGEPYPFTITWDLDSGGIKSGETI